MYVPQHQQAAWASHMANLDVSIKGAEGCRSILQPFAEGTVRAFRVIDAYTDMLIIKLMLEQVRHGLSQLWPGQCAASAPGRPSYRSHPSAHTLLPDCRVGGTLKKQHGQ